MMHQDRLAPILDLARVAQFAPKAELEALPRRSL